MFYWHKCSYCSKVFYVFEDSRSSAAQKLYEGIKKHLVEYGEDHKEYEFDEDPSIEVSQMTREMEESEDRPVGGYEV